MATDRNAPVHDWPLSEGEPGREVWYSLVNSQDGSVAFWYRYTLLSTTAGYREGRLWAALTDRDVSGASTFLSRSVPIADTRVSSDPFRLTIDDDVLTSDAASGTVENIEWDLIYEPDTFVFTPIRSEELIDQLWEVEGTGKHWSRNQSVHMSGTVEVGDRTIELEDAPGHQGHTVTQVTPPEQWTWVHCNDFAENDTAVLEALRLEDTLSVCFRIDGDEYPLNRITDISIGAPGGNEIVTDDVSGCTFTAEGDGIALEATVEPAEDCWQTVAYKVPDGSLRYNAHCSLSSVTVAFEDESGEEHTLTSEACRAEWVGLTPPVEGEYAPSWE